MVHPLCVRMVFGDSVKTETETYPLQKGVLKDIISLGGCNSPVAIVLTIRGGRGHFGQPPAFTIGSFTIRQWFTIRVVHKS